MKVIQLAIWYLRKRGMQVIIGVDFEGEVNVRNDKGKPFYLYDNRFDVFNLK